jgi:hypothetical protein
MGLFSGIVGAIKDVFSGILDVFQPVLAPISKALDSKLGKALMLGLSIFTLGTSMMAGFQAFQAAGGAGNFMSAFVKGAGQFMKTMFTGKGFEGGEIPGMADATANAAQTQGVTGAANKAVEAGGMPELIGEGSNLTAGFVPPTDAATSAAKNLAGSGAADPFQMTAQSAFGGGKNLQQPASSLDPAQGLLEKAKSGGKGMSGMAAQQGYGAAEKQGWLSRAADKATAFAKTESGGNIIGKMIEGIGGYYTQKDDQEFQDRIRRQWGKGDKDEGIRNMRRAHANFPGIRMGSVAQVSGVNRAAGGRPAYGRR